MLILWLFTSCVWDILRYRILRKKQLLIFFGNVVCVVSYCVQLTWWFSSKPSEKYWAISPKGKHKLSKTTFSTFQKCLLELSFAFSFGGNYKISFETFLRSLLGTIPVFCFQMQNHVSAAPVLAGYVWYFGSLHPALEMSWDIEYLWKQLLFHEQNRNFPKRRWVRSRNVSLSSARLDSLVVKKKAALRTCWDLSTWNNTCFLFKCRVTFWLRYFSNATFGTSALYILRLRCLVISNT